jgi:hypothetical protein
MVVNIIVGVLGVITGSVVLIWGPMLAKRELTRLKDPGARRRAWVFGSFDYERELRRAVLVNRIVGVSFIAFSILIAIGAIR